MTLDGLKVKYTKIDEIDKTVAELLSKGEIIARFNGAMEFGPRALGNRSILAAATECAVQNSLNAKLKRDVFMPFAPSILKEYQSKCCEAIDKAEYSARFMNISFNATEYFKGVCPAAVHRDGTTRPHFVCDETNSDFYRILKNYNQITSIPALLNTSFNNHEEPIVCSPEDAIKSFYKSNLDYLAIGDFLVKRRSDAEKE